MDWLDSLAHLGRGGRVVECARLEIGCAERYRGFESLPLRHTASSGQEFCS